MGIFSFMKRKHSLGERAIGAIFTGLQENAAGTDATAWAAMDMISSSIANLAGSVLNRATKEAVNDHPVSFLMKQPNLDETRFLFVYRSVQDYFRHGNIFWLKSGTGNRTVALFRLDPGKVKTGRNPDNRKTYTYGGTEYGGDEILHIPSRFGYDGLTGKSIMEECGGVFKTAGDLDSFTANSFGNNIGNRLVIDLTKAAKNATQEQILRYRDEFLSNYTGIKNAGKPIVKSNDIEYGTISTEYKDNRANQLLENRTFQEKEIAKLFGIPLALLNGKAAGDVESLYILYIENAIRPVATAWEQAVNMLFPPAQREKLCYEFNYNGLLKTSLTTRVTTYAQQLTNGILSPNEIRRKENLPPVEAGDTVFIPANLMPLKNDVVDSYMAGAKTKMQELNTESPATAGNHSGQGDDRGK